MKLGQAGKDNFLSHTINTINTWVVLVGWVVTKAT